MKDNQMLTKEERADLITAFKNGIGEVLIQATLIKQQVTEEERIIRDREWDTYIRSLEKKGRIPLGVFHIDPNSLELHTPSEEKV